MKRRDFLKLLGLAPVAASTTSFFDMGRGLSVTPAIPALKFVNDPDTGLYRADYQIVNDIYRSTYFEVMKDAFNSSTGFCR